jgi:hypothetical protein
MQTFLHWNILTLKPWHILWPTRCHARRFFHDPVSLRAVDRVLVAMKVHRLDPYSPDVSDEVIPWEYLVIQPRVPIFSQTRRGVERTSAAQ